MTLNLRIDNITGKTKQMQSCNLKNPFAVHGHQALSLIYLGCDRREKGWLADEEPFVRDDVTASRIETLFYRSTCYHTYSEFPFRPPLRSDLSFL